MFQDLLHNPVLICGLVPWLLAQGLKVPIYLLVYRKWTLAPLFSAGGMPSSHSALMTGVTTGIGLYQGFGSPLFALAFAITMVVTYDAAGVRREAGYHAEKINQLFNELFSGQPISERRLKEVLGHTPRQVFVGSVLGVVVALLLYKYWL